MIKEKIVIGSRGSKLALIQAEAVAGKLRLARPYLKTEISKIVTEGDRNYTINIEETGEVGIFVKALEDALIKGDIDLAVHSLKDLPVILPQGLCLAAVTKREDPRDALVAAAPVAALKPGARIGTSSIRRSVQLKRFRGDLAAVGIRGNVDSRLRKVESGAFDGIIVAAAAMLRLGRGSEITEYLAVEHFVPAAGQGALALEARCDDAFTTELAGLLNDLPTWQATTAERSFLDMLGGGCSAPISSFARVEDGRLKIIGMVADRSGQTFLRDGLEDDLQDTRASGVRLARRMLESGAAKVIAEMRCK